MTAFQVYRDYETGPIKYIIRVFQRSKHGLVYLFSVGIQFSTTVQLLQDGSVDLSTHQDHHRPNPWATTLLSVTTVFLVTNNKFYVSVIRMVAFAFSKHMKSQPTVSGRGENRSKIKVKSRLKSLTHFLGKRKARGGNRDLRGHDEVERQPSLHQGIRVPPRPPALQRIL